MKAVDDETLLSCAELAALVGPRRAGKPTNPETVRAWMLQGICGVYLASEMDIGIRRTTWRKFLEFRRRVATVKEERRQDLIEAARRGKRGSPAQRAAKRKLERMGAL